MYKEYDKIDYSQITYMTNRKTLISACDSLELPDFNDEKEKSFSNIHGRYSRIKICVTDFSASPSVFVRFFLTPAQIRRIHRQTMIAKGKTEFSVKWIKKASKPVTETLIITREPFKIDASGNKTTVAASHPWKFRISVGEKAATKMLTDEEAEDFFTTIVTYLNAWETAMAPAHITKVRQKLANRFKERDEDDEGESVTAPPARPQKPSAAASGNSIPLPPEPPPARGAYRAYGSDELV